jgi:hypothetical protein
MFKDKKLFTIRHLVLFLLVVTLVALFFAHNILYWLMGILLTQCYILSSKKLRAVVDKQLLHKIPVRPSNRIFSMTVLSILGFSFCLGFFSVTEYLSPAKSKTSTSVAGVLDDRYIHTKIEPRTTVLANNPLIDTTAVSINPKLENIELPAVQNPNQSQATNQNPTSQPATTQSPNTIDDGQSTNFSMTAKPAPDSKVAVKKTTQPTSTQTKKSSIDYKAKLAYDKNKDGKISCKDFSKNLKDVNILNIFPSLDPDKNGIGCE